MLRTAKRTWKFNKKFASLLLYLKSSYSDLTRNDLYSNNFNSLCKKYSISSITGFLPESQPLKSLPSIFKPWEEFMILLPKYLCASNIRNKIRSLPDFEYDKLSNKREYNRAMLILSIISHSYIWGELPILNILPLKISKPWVNVSQKLSRPPILSCESICSQNWSTIDIKKPVSLGNIYPLNTFYGGIDESWFYMVTVDIEAKGSRVIKLICDMLYSIHNNHMPIFISSLNELYSCLKEMIDSLFRMYENCNSWVYYNRVRLFLSGWTSDILNNKGMIYEGQFDERPQYFHGASAAQSPLLHILDEALGIKHYSTQKYMLSMREYMPRNARDFIYFIKCSIPIRDYVLRSKDKEMKNSFNACIKKLHHFRKLHMKIAVEYIIKENKYAMKNKGTGGTDILDFLNSVKDDTISGFVE